MQSDSLSLDTLRNKLLCAVDAEYNVIKAETVLDIICQLEKMEITKDQLQTTRLGREINTIRQKLDTQNEKHSKLINEIAQRAKKLLRSWQGLLNISQTNLSSTNVDIKPRLILKVKLNSPITKRKYDFDSHIIHSTNIKRKKTQVIQTPVPISTPIILSETNVSLPRLKTTQQLLIEMQKNEPNVLSTQTSTVHAILQKKIIDESLHEQVKLDYSALHHGRDLNNINTKNQHIYNVRFHIMVISSSTHYQRKLSSSITSPCNTFVTSGSSSKLQSLIERSSSSSTLISSNSNWENGSSAGSPISPLSSSSSSSSSIICTTSWPLSTIIPEPSLNVPVITKKKRRKKHNEQLLESSNIEQSKIFSSDLETLCSSYNSVADLVEDHRRRILAKYESRELEARPDLLLVPIDQLAFVYERERTKELNLPNESKHSSMTTVEKLTQPFDLIALPFIDCPLEYDLILDELVVQHPTMDM
ncbi:unnamed protein product [Rotaria sordida]|uniref:TFIIS N-terminal domain-containing protein n=1 Tax=Rotaria sordida TaxID=392033 RepID=A0A819G4W2_9BILA|nr:unnamed protein product [Rotaria sordida]